MIHIQCYNPLYVCVCVCVYARKREYRSVPMFIHHVKGFIEYRLLWRGEEEMREISIADYLRTSNVICLRPAVR